mmetsp:Transcript_1080/g.2600  ORF Transcript_1080/g.2600 Transcript_1080/m.2600 type:complete len:83 (-) Transcript_1080:726-974(-)
MYLVVAATIFISCPIEEGEYYDLCVHCEGWTEEEGGGGEEDGIGEEEDYGCEGCRERGEFGEEVEVADGGCAVCGGEDLLVL